MSNLLNKKVTKLTVSDLKTILKECDNNSEVVLGFYMKDEGVTSVYLAEVFTNMKFDSVTSEKLTESNVVELIGFKHEYCTYVEREDD